MGRESRAVAFVSKEWKITQNFFFDKSYRRESNHKYSGFWRRNWMGLHNRVAILPKTKYYILETPESNLLFKDFWKKKEMSPIFHSDYKEIEDHIDIFYVNSDLQYLENNDHLIDVISFFLLQK